MFTLSGPLVRQGLFRCLGVPKKKIAATNPPVHVPVIVTLDDDRFESTLSSWDPRHYRLVIPAPLLRERKLDVGDPVTVTIDLDCERRAPPLPPDVKRGFRADGKTLAIFAQLTVNMQRQLVRYVEQAVSPEVRAERIELLALRLRERHAKQVQRQRARAGKK